MENQIQIRERSALTQSESLAVEASTGTRIVAATREELSQLFRRIMVLVGVSNQNVPTKIDADLLLDTAPAVIGKWTLQEVLLAFQMALKGEIEAELNLYDKPFSLMYVSNVLKAYDALRRDALHKHNREIDLLPESKEPTLEERNALMRREALTCYARHCSGEANSFDYHPALYDYLQRIGAVLFSPERIQRATEEAIRQIKVEAVRGNGYTTDMRDALARLSSKDTPVERKAKELLLREFFVELNNGHNELKDLI